MSGFLTRDIDSGPTSLKIDGALECTMTQGLVLLEAAGCHC